jgi:radical SAM superfamily enzyme YgiQ (UPF0313 family)
MDAIEKAISGFKPDLIGISFLSFQTDSMVAVAKKSHALLKKLGRREVSGGNYVPIVVGGAGTFACEKIVPLYWKLVDAWVLGEGLETMLEIMHSVEKGTFIGDRKNIKGLIFFDQGAFETVKTPAQGPINELDSFSPPLRLHHYPAYDFGEIFGGKKTAQMMTSFGCPNACFFCHEGLNSPLVRERSLANVERELESLVADGYRAVYFDDSTFTANRERTLGVVEILSRLNKNQGLVWGFNTRADFLDFELVKEIKDAGCAYMFVGVESLVPEVLSGLNKIGAKNFDYPPIVRTPEQYIGRTVKAYRWMARAGLVKSCFLIFGGPKLVREDGKAEYVPESFEDAKKTTRKAVFELNPEYLAINILRFIPNSIYAVSRAFAGFRGTSERIHAGYYCSDYRKINKIRPSVPDHPVYHAFESAAGFYPIPPHMTPEYCHQILGHLINAINQKNSKSKTKTKIFVGEKFKKYLEYQEGQYALAPFGDMAEA